MSFILIWIQKRRRIKRGNGARKRGRRRDDIRRGTFPWRMWLQTECLAGAKTKAVKSFAPRIGDGAHPLQDLASTTRNEGPKWKLGRRLRSKLAAEANVGKLGKTNVDSPSGASSCRHGSDRKTRESRVTDSCASRGAGYAVFGSYITRQPSRRQSRVESRSRERCV